MRLAPALTACVTRLVMPAENRCKVVESSNLEFWGRQGNEAC